MNPLHHQDYDPKNLHILFFGLLFAQIIFLLGAIFLMEDAQFGYEYSNLSYTLIPIAALVLDYIGNKLFINGFNKLTTLREIDQSLQQLTRIHLLRWALVEGATFLLIVAAFFFNSHFFTAFAAANIVYFSTLRPRLFTFNEEF